MASAASGHNDLGEVLGRISREMVHALKEHYGKGPTHAKSYLCDNVLLVVMSGGLLTAEQTMLEHGREDLVRDFRQQFENEMAEPFATLVESVVGRKVINYQSQIMFAPDMVFELFVLEGSDERESDAEAAG